MTKQIAVMDYFFEQYEFDADSLILKKNGEAVDIRRNEALLLKLLIENHQSVISKEAILSEVWQGKVVSEQAIFQNISNLRALFGSHAIKTFAKRGYQWQLPLISEPLVVQQSQTIQADIALTNNTANTSTQKRTYYQLFALFALVALIAISYFSLPKKPVAPTIAVIPFTGIETEQPTLTTDLLPPESVRLNDIDPYQYAATEILSYANLKAQYPLVLTGTFWQAEQQIHADFSLTGPKGSWQGQFIGESKAQVMQQLKSHLKLPIVLEMVNQPLSANVKQAKLSIVHQERPNDLIILNQLTNAYLSMSNFDSAMLLADKLEQTSIEQQNLQQQGNALLLQSTILTAKEVYELSDHKLTEAIKIFQQINDHKRLADAYNAQSWLDHQSNDYQAIKKHMLLSLEHSLKAKDINRELHALTYLSVLAHKHKMHDDKYLYLQQAESRMDHYQLPRYRYAKIPFHHAIYSGNAAQKEPHLKNVLEYTQLTPDHWVAQSSRKQLLDYYIKTNRINLASEMVSPLGESTPENNLLKARLAKAQQKEDEFEYFGKKAFEQAQLTGKVSLSLDIALLMCEEPNKQVNYDFYYGYIEDNASKYWLQRNQKKLHVLNIQ